MTLQVILLYLNVSHFKSAMYKTAYKTKGVKLFTQLSHTALCNNILSFDTMYK